MSLLRDNDSNCVFKSAKSSTFSKDREQRESILKNICIANALSLDSIQTFETT